MQRLVLAARFLPVFRRSAQLTLLVLFLVFTYVGFAYATVKYRALSYNDVDFTCYLEFFSKLLDPTLSPRYSLNPNGHNYMGFSGIDGSGSVHISTHFEPLKYLDALVYRISGTYLAMFLLYSALFFMPLIYLALIMAKLDLESAFFATLVYMIYAFLPQNMESASYDLRPYSLLAPLVLVLLTAIILSRPFPEILVLLNCMFLLREESLILVPVLVLFLVSHERTYGRRVQPSYWVWFAVSWLFWAGITVGYYIWTGLSFEGPGTELSRVYRFATGIGWVLIPVLFVFLLSLYAFRGFLIRRLSWVSLGLLAAPWILEFANRKLLRGTLLEEAPRVLLSEPRWHILWIIALGALLYSWRRVATRDQQRFLASVAAIGLLLVVYLCFFGQSTPWQRYRSYRAAADDAQVVFALRDRTLPAITVILTDYKTHKAFFDYERVYSYERLPWYLVQGKEEGRYPQNEEKLQQLLKEEVDWVVATRGEARQIKKIATKAQVTMDLDPSSNGAFSIYHINR